MTAQWLQARAVEQSVAAPRADARSAIAGAGECGTQSQPRATAACARRDRRRHRRHQLSERRALLFRRASSASSATRSRDRSCKEYRFSESLHPDDRDRVIAAPAPPYRSGAALREECRLQRADGNYVWVTMRGETVRGSDGKTTRLVLSIVDTTEHRLAQQRLTDSELRYRALVEASPSLIWVCDATGRLTFVSERACRRMFGFEPRETDRATCRRLQRPEIHAPRIPAALFAGHARQAGVRHGGDERDQRAEPLHVNVSSLPMLNDAGRDRVGDWRLQRHHGAEAARARAQRRDAQPAGGVRRCRRGHRIRPQWPYRGSESARWPACSG